MLWRKMKQEIVVPGERSLLRKKIFRKNLKELRELASGYLRKENSRSWEHRVKRDWCLSCLLCLRTAWRPVWLE